MGCGASKPRAKPVHCPNCSHLVLKRRPTDKCRVCEKQAKIDAKRATKESRRFTYADEADSGLYSNEDDDRLATSFVYDESDEHSQKIGGSPTHRSNCGIQPFKQLIDADRAEKRAKRRRMQQQLYNNNQPPLDLLTEGESMSSSYEALGSVTSVQSPSVLSAPKSPVDSAVQVPVAGGDSSALPPVLQRHFSLTTCNKPGGSSVSLGSPTRQTEAHDILRAMVGPEAAAERVVLFVEATCTVSCIRTESFHNPSPPLVTSPHHCTAGTQGCDVALSQDQLQADNEEPLVFMLSGDDTPQEADSVPSSPPTREKTAMLDAPFLDSPALDPTPLGDDAIPPPVVLPHIPQHRTNSCSGDLSSTQLPKVTSILKIRRTSSLCETTDGSKTTQVSLPAGIPLSPQSIASAASFTSSSSHINSNSGQLRLLGPQPCESLRQREKIASKRSWW